MAPRQLPFHDFLFNCLGVKPSPISTLLNTITIFRQLFKRYINIQSKSIFVTYGSVNKDMKHTDLIYTFIYGFFSAFYNLLMFLNLKYTWGFNVCCKMRLTSVLKCKWGFNVDWTSETSNLIIIWLAIMKFFLPTYWYDRLIPQPAFEPAIFQL